MGTLNKLADLQRTFVAPPRLAMSRPRPVQLTAGGRALVALAVLLFFGSVGGGLLLFREAREQAGAERALVDRGAVTAGEVTRLWPSGDNFRRVRYRFVVDGRAYESTERVSTSRRRTLHVGSAIEVRYVHGDPAQNDLGGTPDPSLPIWLPFLVSTAAAAMGLLCLFAIQKQRRLLTDGRAAPAIVMSHHRHHTGHGGTHRSLTYEFPLLNGAVATGRSQTSSKPPAVGSVICVIYDSDRPTRSMAYPLSLVQPAR